VSRARQILTAAAGARWPMYLRNVKQILRQADGGFDERRYGFGGLMDLLKALQREGFVRIERDRRGGLRVFQGQAMQAGVHARPMAGLPQDEPVEVVDGEAIETQPGEAIQRNEPAETEMPEAEPIPIDTTAELLGRAKARKPRTRAARPSLREAQPAQPPRAARAAKEKGAAKKPAARRSARGKKASAADAGGEKES